MKFKPSLTQAGLFFALPRDLVQLTMRAEEKLAWDIAEPQTSQWLQALGFNPQKKLQPAWTEACKAQFQDGLMRW